MVAQKGAFRPETPRPAFITSKVNFHPPFAEKNYICELILEICGYGEDFRDILRLTHSDTIEPLSWDLASGDNINRFWSKQRILRHPTYSFGCFFVQQ